VSLGLHHRRRIRQPGGLDDDAVEIRDLSDPAPREQVAQGLLQVGAHRAADATVGQQRDVLGRHGDQLMVDADLADFVDHHCCVAHVGVAHQAGQQRGLAAAQEPRDQRDRNPAGQWVTRVGQARLRGRVPARTGRR
jgi:hypothetical protein